MSADWSEAPEGATHWDAAELGFMRPSLTVGNWDHFVIGDKWAFYGRINNQIRSDMVARPVAWQGEGLPPVGAKVECGFAFEDFRVWHVGVCIAVGEDPEGREDFCVVKFGNKMATYRADVGLMRPIRTAEQIEAEAFEAGVVEMRKVINESSTFDHGDSDIEALWKAGYRKQPAP
jgi:hypothetical protein